MNCTELLEKTISDERLELLRMTGSTGDSAGVRTFLVGGAVRDVIAERTGPDLDVMVEGDAIEFARNVATTSGCGVKTHPEFGTATLIFDNIHLDLATARTETYAKPGALPVVSPATIEEDLRRRDFSINAMCISLNSATFGELLDPLGGLDDLRNGLIRVLHDNSFIDDPTRLFRAIRFKCRFGFDYHKDTWKLMKKAIADDALDAVSGARIKKELQLMLKEERRGWIMNECHRMRLDSAITAGIVFVGRLVSPEDHVAFAFTRVGGCAESAEISEYDCWIVYLAAITRSGNSNVTNAFADRISLDKKERDVLIESLILPGRVFDTIAEFDDEEIGIADLMDSLSYQSIVYIYAAVDDETRKRIELYCNELRHIRLEINGNDVIEMGVKPSKDVDEVLREVLRMKRKGEIETKEEELEKARELAAQMAGSE